MPEQDPLEKFIAEIARIMAFLEDNKDKSIEEIPKDVLDQLTALEAQANLLAKVNESLFAESGITKEQIRDVQTSDVPPNMLNMLDKIQEMRKEFAVMQGKAAAAHIIAKRKEKMSDRDIIARKKKFRRLRGDWKPM